jgi:hypothetical protein
MNKNNEYINKINDSNIIIIYLTKIYTDYIIYQLKDIFKCYLKILNVDLEIEFDNNNFDYNINKIIKYIKDNYKLYFDNFKLHNEKYNNDIKLLNSILLFNIN